MTRTIDLEARYCAHNYHPLPVVLTRGEGVFVWAVQQISDVIEEAEKVRLAS